MFREEFRRNLANPKQGILFKDITPANYVEGPFVFKRQGKYYLMWSEGGWQGPNYSVAYALWSHTRTTTHTIRRTANDLYQC